MSKTITKTVYRFAELLELRKAGNITEQALNRAREALSPHYDWSGDELANAKEELAALGFEGADISFSGFCSQGDGASFTSSCDLGKLVDFLAGSAQSDNWVAKGFAPSGNNYAGLAEIDLRLWVERGSSHYVHERTCGVQWESSYAITDDQFNAISVLVCEVEALRIHCCRTIYQALEAQYEYLTSDEYYTGEESQEVYFDRHGRLEN